MAAAFADNLVMMEDGHRSSLSGFANLMTKIKVGEFFLAKICAKGSRPMEMNHAAFARSTALRVSLKRGLARQALTLPVMPVPSILW